ncbi:MAG: M20/M25/M40 family metallo-hydrolase, partial [Acidobacteria bacterium]|nr:M20/M25/M40 family metallo-hydrolase [Acidobacteriota bacterium]
MMELLERLVKIESPSLDAAAQREILGVLAEALEALGMETKRLRGPASGGHLLARPRDRRRRRPCHQMLLGHCDTVWPKGTLATMPWQVEEGIVRGPGVYDMKSGLVQGIFALEALTALGRRPPLTPWFFIDSDEEIGSRESRRYLERLARGMDRVFVL